VIGAIAFVLLLSGGSIRSGRRPSWPGAVHDNHIFMCYALYKDIRADFREPLDRQEGGILAEQSAGQTTPNLGKYPNRSHL
jgi:hypothetical protein